RRPPENIQIPTSNIQRSSKSQCSKKSGLNGLWCLVIDPAMAGLVLVRRRTNPSFGEDVGVWSFEPLPFWINFVPDQFLHGLSIPDQRSLVAAHEHFGGKRPRIVIRCHDKSVGPSTHDREQIALPHFRHFAVQREKVPRFTHRSN